MYRIKKRLRMFLDQRRTRPQLELEPEITHEDLDDDDITMDTPDDQTTDSPLSRRTMTRKNKQTRTITHNC